LPQKFPSYKSYKFQFHIQAYGKLRRKIPEHYNNAILTSSDLLAVGNDVGLYRGIYVQSDKRGTQTVEVYYVISENGELVDQSTNVGSLMGEPDLTENETLSRLESAGWTINAN